MSQKIDKKSQAKEKLKELKLILSQEQQTLPEKDNGLNSLVIISTAVALLLLISYLSEHTI